MALKDAYPFGLKDKHEHRLEDELDLEENLNLVHAHDQRTLNDRMTSVSSKTSMSTTLRRRMSSTLRRRTGTTSRSSMSATSRRKICVTSRKSAISKFSRRRTGHPQPRGGG